jgi:methionyl-tRNA formyltransferase
MPRIVFAGTPEFALASLAALVDAGHIPVAVYTQPDRPAGRGRRTTESPVKGFAEQAGIPVLQPETLRDEAVASELEALNPDILIVAAYGLILPQRILDIPTHGCLNVHASVLPRWRGAAPIQAAILAGDNSTGVSLMRMTAGLDCGPVFSDRITGIGEHETAGELHDRLATLGGDLLVSDLPKIVAGSLEAVEQNEALATYAGKIKKQDAEIDWTESADALHRHIRAYNPVPGAYFHADDSLRVKVWRASPVDSINAEPGTFVHYDKTRIVVACGTGGLNLESLQLPGKRRASANEFVHQIDLRR